MTPPGHEIEVALPARGVCSVYFTVMGADPSVGIMSAGPDDLNVINSSGVDITEDLMPYELDRVTEACCRYIDGQQQSDYP